MIDYEINTSNEIIYTITCQISFNILVYNLQKFYKVY